MVSIDPLVAIILAVLLGLFFFGYLLVRRTLMSLREGYQDGKQ